MTSLFDVIDEPLAAEDESPIAVASPRVAALRIFQVEVLDRARRRVGAGLRRGIIQAPTGSGKTYMEAEQARCAAAKGKRCLILADRRRLVKQIGDTLDVFGVPYGVIMAGESRLTHLPTIVGSRDTLAAWMKNGLDVAPFDLVQIDEGHKSLGEVYQWLLSLFPKAVVVAYTATPARGDGRMLSSFYQWLECAAPPSQLIRDGYLVKPEVYAPMELAAKRKKGVSTRGLAGDPVAHWRRHAEGLPTIAFAANRAESLALMKRFADAGIAAEHIDATFGDDDREAAYARLQSGRTQVLCSVKLLIEGVDFPGVSCAILWAKFGSVIEYFQAIGRIMRPAPGKTRAIVLDHSGAAGVHGLPGEDVAWSLDDGSTVEQRRQKDIDEGKVAKPVVCRGCGLVFAGDPACPGCGWRPRTQEKSAREARHVHRARDEVLARYDGEAGADRTAEVRQRYWASCIYQAVAKGAKAGMAAARFRGKFGVPPWSAGVEPLPDGIGAWQLPAAEVFPSFVRRKGA
jgi:DNA repair protein RadD